MVVISGSLRCGLKSLENYIKKKKKGNIKILPYLMFDPRAYKEFVNSAEKIAIILRKPAERAFSLWKSNVQNGLEWLNFENAVAMEQKRFYNLRNEERRWRYLYFRGGLYSKIIERFQKSIGKENIRKTKFFLFEDILSDSDFFDFIGIERGKIPHLNKSFIPANAKIQFVLGSLREIFEEKEIKGKNMIKSFIKILMELNIAFQKVIRINDTDRNKDTISVVEFLKYAYLEDMEKISKNLPEIRKWLDK